jgi:hypothetical protein
VRRLALVALGFAATAITTTFGITAAPIAGGHLPKADTVIIDEGSRLFFAGKVGFTLGGQGMDVGPGEPLGPVVVYVFRTIPEENRETLKQLGLAPVEGSTYIWRKKTSELVLENRTGC